MEKQHLPWKKLALSAMFLALAALCVFLALRLTARKDSVIKYGDFFEHAAEIDVLFLGSSHVINGVNPVELYEQYGYTSYNMGGHGSTLPATYWELMMALDYCAPKVVVVDTYMLEKDYQYIDVMYEHSTDAERASSISQLHLNMDAFPLNATKKAAIKDLIQDPEVRRQFYHPEVVYHTRWSELSEADYALAIGRGERNALLGCELRYGIEVEEEPPARLGWRAAMDAPTVGVSYLMQIIEECQSSGIGILLTCLPLYGTQEDEKAAAGAALIAAEYGVPFINYYDQQDDRYLQPYAAVDLHADFNDHGHLNVTGTAKVTFYLGDILRQQFELTDHRGDPAYAFWQECVDAYAPVRKNARINVDNVYMQVNQLARGIPTVYPFNAASSYNDTWFTTIPDTDNLSCIIFLRFHSPATEDTALLHLIDYLRGPFMWASPSSDRPLSWLLPTDGCPYLYVHDHLYDTFREDYDGEAMTGIKTALGNLTYAPQDIYCALTSDAAPEENLLNMEEHYDADVQIIIYDDSGEILSHRCYYMNPTSYRSEAAR